MTNPASQQPAPIPEDLRQYLEVARDGVEAHREGSYAYRDYQRKIELVERIARLEAALTECLESDGQEGPAMPIDSPRQDYE